MKRHRVIAGWTRIPEPKFKAGIMDAAKTEPDLCPRLRLAVKAAAARRGVPRDLRDQYLRWVAEAEAAMRLMADAKDRPLPQEVAPAATAQGPVVATPS